MSPFCRHNVHTYAATEALKSPPLARVWNSGLTKSQVKDIENIQKIEMKIILDDNYISYDVACTLLNISPLDLRRLDLSTNFAIKLFKSQRSLEFFEPA